MFDVERFIKNNSYRIENNSESKEIAAQVIEELKQIQVNLESELVEEAKKIFIKYKVTPFTIIVESYQIQDIDLFEYYMYHSLG